MGCGKLSFDLSFFKEAFTGSILLENEPMKNHTSFRVGGPADLMLVPDSVETLKTAVKICTDNNINYCIVGKCSNLLVRDAGFRGVIIKIGKDISGIDTREGEEPGTVIVSAQAGVSLSDLSRFVCDKGLTGFEFASGIPGTLGGAVCMNAGAYGSEIKDILKTASVLCPDGKIMELSETAMEFGYRTSVIQKTKNIVISANLLLNKGKTSDISNKIDELTNSRNEKQPLGQPSAGSTFKRPQGYYAGKLITDAGLKGYSIGGAMVSEKHAGFIVNYNNASAKDITDLIEHVIMTVKQKFDVVLEPEVKIIGDV